MAAGLAAVLALRALALEAAPPRLPPASDERAHAAANASISAEPTSAPSSRR